MSEQVRYKGFKADFGTVGKVKEGLLDLLIIVGFLVSLFLVALAYVVLSPAWKERRQEAREVILLRDLLAGIYTLYKDKSSYQGLNTELLIRSGLIPKENIKEGKIVGYFGENIEVQEANDGSKFAIVYESLPASPCARLIAYASKFPKYEGEFIQNEKYKHYNAVGLSAPECSKENNRVKLIFK